jgi:hypothetical protein
MDYVNDLVQQAAIAPVAPPTADEPAKPSGDA